MDAARENFVLLIALLSVLVFTGGAALFAVGLMLLHREEPKTAPKPRAENRNRQVSVPAHPAPVPVSVVYQEVTRLPMLDGDITEVRVNADPTRYDLLHKHVERGIRAREGRAS